MNLFSIVRNIFRRKFKIFVYTDSRGDNIPGHTNYQHYVARLEKKYDVEKHLCPEKWTTTLDFLNCIKKTDLKKYDLVILHTGIVDQSPRHQKVAIENLYKDKKAIFDEVFDPIIMHKHLTNDFRIEYEGDKTINMYSMEMAKKNLLPILKKIPNLLWISHNKIVPNWKGNYWKERPENINIIEQYSNLFLSELPNTINLMIWDFDEVKKFTFDNMHPNKFGSDFIYDSIEQKIRKLK